MTRRSGAELAALLLTQRLVEGSAPPLKAGEFWALVAAVGDLGRLLGLDATQIAAAAGIDLVAAQRLAILLDGATAFAFALDQAEQGGLQLLVATGGAYPSRLTARLHAAAPPVLYVLGDPDLLGRTLLGIVGSRAVGDEGARVSEGAAALAVAQGMGIVSGGAHGVDRLAMDAALEAGGVVVGVLADSLLRASRHPPARRAMSAGTLCLCSPYQPDAPFSAAQALGRNKLIYALSAATLVVACQEESGGSWAGAVDALRRQTAPVLVWSGVGAPPGNQALAAKGAVPVDDLERLLPLPATPEPPPVPAQPGERQLALGL